MGSTTRLARREPWTVERTLHLALAGIAVIGWTLAYTALMRGTDSPRDPVARGASAGTKVSASLTASPSGLPPAPRR